MFYLPSLPRGQAQLAFQELGGIQCLAQRHFCRVDTYNHGGGLNVASLVEISNYGVMLPH